MKVVYLAIAAASKKWTMPIRNWKPALNRFTIVFGERITAYLKPSWVFTQNDSRIEIPQPRDKATFEGLKREIQQLRIGDWAALFLLVSRL